LNNSIDCLKKTNLIKIQKKKPGWALGAKDGEGVAKSGSEGGGLNQGVEEVGEMADVAA